MLWLVVVACLHQSALAQPDDIRELKLQQIALIAERDKFMASAEALRIERDAATGDAKELETERDSLAQYINSATT